MCITHTHTHTRTPPTGFSGRTLPLTNKSYQMQRETKINSENDLATPLPHQTPLLPLCLLDALGPSHPSLLAVPVTQHAWLSKAQASWGCLAPQRLTWLAPTLYSQLCSNVTSCRDTFPDHSNLNPTPPIPTCFIYYTDLFSFMAKTTS